MSDFDPVTDGERAKTQYERVFELMSDGKWRTLHQISAVVPGVETALSTRLREIEAAGHVKNKRTKSPGLIEYQIILCEQGEMWPVRKKKRLGKEEKRAFCNAYERARYRLTEDERRAFEPVVQQWKKAI